MSLAGACINYANPSLSAGILVLNSREGGPWLSPQIDTNYLLCQTGWSLHKLRQSLPERRHPGAEQPGGRPLAVASNRHKLLTVSLAGACINYANPSLSAGILVLNSREGGPAWKAGIKGTTRDDFGRLVLGGGPPRGGQWGAPPVLCPLC